jgi:DNA-binding NtrC family response regulator
VLDRAWVLSGKANPFFSELKLFLEACDPKPAGPAPDISLPFKSAKEQWLDLFELQYIAAVYDRFSRNMTHAAEHAGLSRRHFRVLVQKHKLDKR